MKTNTVNISFQSNLLTQIDSVARQETRSRSELIREAARMYIARKKRWKEIFAFGRKKAKGLKIQEGIVSQAIADFRQRRQHQ